VTEKPLLQRSTGELLLRPVMPEGARLLHATRLVLMGALAAIGRPSGAALTNPRALAAPAEPYRPSMTSPWRRGQAPVVELPIAVTPWTRVPAIGTTWAGGGVASRWDEWRGQGRAFVQPQLPDVPLSALTSGRAARG